MKPTNEQIIAEAHRRFVEEQRNHDGLTPEGSSFADHIIEVMRENWTPPEPVVDPDVLAFREWAAKDWVERYPAEVDDVQRGKRDGCDIAKAFVAGARMARAQARPLALYLQDRADRDDAEADRILNQHLIDAALKRGIELGLEAAARACLEKAEYFAHNDAFVVGQPLSNTRERHACVRCAYEIRDINPDTIAREAVLDQLTSEAQADNMGYDNEPR